MSQVEGSNQWRSAVSGGGKRSELEGSVRWWRSSGLSEGERGERSNLRWREHSLVEEIDLRWTGAVSGGGERSQVEESDLWWREAVSGGGERGERSQMQVSGHGRRRRGAISGRGERSQVQGSVRRRRSDLRWRGAVSGRRKGPQVAGLAGALGGADQRPARQNQRSAPRTRAPPVSPGLHDPQLTP